jgi:cytochrome c553
VKTPIRTAHLLAIVLAGATSACSSARSAPPPTPPGHELFQLCAQCHTESGGGNLKVNAPSIAGMPQWYLEAQLKNFKAGGRGTHFDDITGMQMRPMAMSLITDAEIKAVAEYVAKLPAQKPAATDVVQGDASKGQALFATCVACHGADAAGNEQLKAPPLTHTNDWYLVRSLEKFKAGVRGTNPLDTSGALMRPMALTLADEQAMKDVVAYIMTLRK